MRIVIDARMYAESGIGRYLKNLLFYLQQLDKKNDYFILLLEKDYDSLVNQHNFTKISVNVKWYSLEEQIKLPQILNKLKPDLVHFPHFNIPIFYKGKFVVTIHDLIHQHFNFQRASTHDALTFKLKQFGYKQVFQKAISDSTKIMVPSNFVKNQLKKEWNVDEKKVVVTPEGVDEEILKKYQISNIKCQILLKKLNIKQPYIFYVGSAHPHKNIEGLIKTFLQIKKNFRYLKLVLTGADNYFWQRIKKEFQDKDIIYTGLISDEELVALYKNAKAFIMPSFEEGFGIPLLEAMACECLVISSNGGSLQEVGGNAAIYFDPHNMDEMVKKISEVLSSEKKRLELIAKGKVRVKEFNWKKLAEQTLEVYQKCV